MSILGAQVQFVGANPKLSLPPALVFDLGPRPSGSDFGASRGLHRKRDRADGSMAERSSASRDDVSNDHDVAVDAAAADEATGDGALG